MKIFSCCERAYTITETLIVVIILGLAIGTIFGIAEISSKIWSEGKIASELRSDTRNALHILTSEIRESSLSAIFLGPSSGPPYNAIGIGRAKRNSSNGLICLDSGKIIWDKFIIYYTYNNPAGGMELRKIILDEIDSQNIEANWYTITDVKKQAEVDAYDVDNSIGRVIVKNLQTGASGLLNFSAQEEDHWLETDFSNEDIVKDETLVVSGGNVFLDGGGQAWFVEGQTGADIPEAFDNWEATSSAYRILIKSDYIFKSGSKVKFKFAASSTAGDIALNIKSPSLAETDTDPKNIVEATPPALTFDDPPITNKTITTGEAWTNWLSYVFNKDTNYSLTYYSDTIYTAGDSFYVRKWLDGSGIEPTPTHEFLWNGASVSSTTQDWGEESVGSQSHLIALEEIEVGYCSSGTLTSQIYNTGVDNPAYTTIAGNTTVPTGTDIKVKVRSSENEDMSGATPWDDADITEFTFTDGSNSHDISAASVNDIGEGRYVQFQATLTSSPDYEETPVLKDITVTWQGGIISITVDRYYNYRGKLYSVPMVSDAKPKNK